MYNRLSNYWYNEAPEAPPADAEEVRRRRLEQLESGPSTAGGPDAVMAEKPVPVVITEAAPVVITEAAPVVITKAAPVVITEAAPVVVKETAPDIAQWDSGPAPSEVSLEEKLGCRGQQWRNLGPWSRESPQQEGPDIFGRNFNKKTFFFQTFFPEFLTQIQRHRHIFG